MAKVAYVGGYWETNVGNGFFNLGADYVLKQVFGEENVTMVFDQPAYITQWNTKKGNPPKAFDYISHLELDYIVLLGPVISRAFLNIWKDTLLKLKEKGTKYMILSAGMMKYDDEVIEECKEFFRECPPYVLTSRETKTYDIFKDYATYAYDGVCFAFFVPDAYKPLKTDIGKNVVLNFDKIPEPKLYINDKTENYDVLSTVNGDEFKFKYFSNILSKIGLNTDRFTDALVYLLSIFPGKKRPTKIDKYTILRTDHRFSPMFMNKVYRYDNSFCADIPHTYANIYAEADITFSDRVHACALTLAYGNYAMLYAKTGRSALLDRVGAKDISEKPVKIDMDYLKEEKQKLLEFLKGIEF